jgi:sucrose phosphorylase
MQRIGERLARLYGEPLRERLLERIALLAGRYDVDACARKNGEDSLWDESDMLLITYGDMLRRGDERPLLTLRRFCDQHLRGAISGIHILPFFPYSSDDGFSVIDFRKVDPMLGSWDDVQAIGERYKLMVDLVLNHASAQSAWFKNYLNGIAPERDYFISVEPDADLSAVVRPRSSPLLSSAQTPWGERFVWTTFSEDQVDLNFSNQDVLFEMLDILLLYVHKGARIIRLDAIAYLWKEPGTSCIHLPQTHEVVKLMRDVLRLLAPGVVLLSETNVPHKENVSYFGNADEAHMVYQFSLPPLLLHALYSGQSRYLKEWAEGLEPPPPGCAYFNFTASHDGIGMRPLEGLLPPEEFEDLVEGMRQRGAQVSTRRNPDGSDSPYELNITYFDALSDVGQTDSDLQIQRFLCSQTIMLSLQGVPGIYFNSLLGSRNDIAGLKTSGRARSINRRKWDEAKLNHQISEEGGLTQQVFSAYLHRLQLRRQRPAFHPDAAQRILPCEDGLFAFLRSAIGDSERVLVLCNLTAQTIEQDPQRLLAEFTQDDWHEIIQDQPFDGDKTERLTLAPYQTMWLRQVKENSETLRNPS